MLLDYDDLYAEPPRTSPQQDGGLVGATPRSSVAPPDPSPTFPTVISSIMSMPPTNSALSPIPITCVIRIKD
jgi:hypothetical protein